MISQESFYEDVMNRMDFLYFPEDKTLYIPAFITLLVFVALAVWAMYWIKRISKKEEKKWEEKYKNYKDD